MVAVVRLYNVQLSTTSVRIDAQEVENTDHLVRLLLMQQQSTTTFQVTDLASKTGFMIL